LEVHEAAQQKFYVDVKAGGEKAANKAKVFADQWLAVERLREKHMVEEKARL